MKNKKTLLCGLLCVCALAAASFAPNFAYASAENSAGIKDSDFFQPASGVTAQPSEDIALTDITMSYTADGCVYYGTEGTAFPADMSSFRWNLTINQLAAGQSFTISFLKDAQKRPFDGAVGVSFVFEAFSEGVLRLYILDAADGSLLQEMIDTDSQWAYQKDGTFPEDYPKDPEAEEGHSHGMVGRLTCANAIGQTLQFVNMVDSASFGGTTNRPAVTTGNSLGTTVPGEIFTNRDMKINNLVLALSAGGQNGTTGPETELSFTVSTPADKKTVAYNSSVSGVKTSISAMVASSEKAAAGTLPADEYFAMKEEFAAVDVSALRPRDKFIQQKNLDKISGNLSLTAEKLAAVPGSVTAYSAALNELKNLADVTQTKIEAAKAAKKEYEQNSAFVKYLEGEKLEEVEALIAALDESLLLRGELHLQICVYEEKTAAFSAAPSSATPEQIYEAELSKQAISLSALDKLSAEDKTAFENRISACDKKVDEARRTNAYDVEAYKINLYKASVSELGADASAADFNRVYGERPELKLDDVMPFDREALEELLAAADKALGEKIVLLMEKWYSAYSAKTDFLDDLSSLTQKKIDEAESAAYAKEDFDALLEISDKIGYDISSVVENLEECDRKVKAAKVRILVTEYSAAAKGEITDLASMNFAYEKYLAVAEADTKLLSAEELAAFDAMKAEADSAYEEKALELIGAALEEFEASVAVEDLSDVEALRNAKAKRAAVPDLKYLIVEEDRGEFAGRYEAADEKLKAEPLYYVETTGTSWTASETEDGIRLDNKLGEQNNCDGLALIQDPLDIDGFDFAFDFTKIGRIWRGEVDGKYPQSIYVMNILNAAGKNKDEAQGFSVYFFLNQMDQIEVNVYAPNRDGNAVMLAQGVIEGVPVTAEPYQPITVRVRVEKKASNYTLWVNSLALNIYYRDFINPAEDNPAYMPEFGVGDEIGENIFRGGKAYVSFVVFAESLTPEERESAITIRMIGDKTFGGYVPPVYTVSVELVSGPAKTEYKKGEAFDKTGIKMTALLSDGTTVEIPLDKIKVLGFTSTSKGTKNVTLSYTDDSGVTLTKVIKVTVVDDEAPAPAPAEGPNKGLIIGLSVGGGIVLVGAAVAVAFVLKAKKKKNDK